MIKDWYDGWISEGDEMNIYLIADTHLKHENMKTYCQRPPDFTENIHANIMNTIKPTDTLIHLGDVGIGNYQSWAWMIPLWPGRKILIRGNHDRNHSCTWWMEKGGFNFACDSIIIRQVLFTHEPANAVIRSGESYGAADWGLPEGCALNIHGHLHNIWDGFHSPDRVARDKELLGVDFTKRLKHPWQRLFALEYTDFMPVEMNKFIAHPDRYQARGPKS